MEVKKFQEDYFELLFSYWKSLAERVPYFFPVSSKKWRQCLLEDELDNEKIFSYQETFVAVEEGRLVGFIQYGKPAFAWDKNGRKYNNPQIGVIRHFYFDEGRFDAANRLFVNSKSYLEQFPSQHAFFHIFGMSCNAHHGKLHQSLAHIDRFLHEKGYQVEHENLYYSLELSEIKPMHQNNRHLVFKPVIKPNRHKYEICLLENPIGTIQIRFLEELTGGYTTDTVYLAWIEINRPFRGQGLGTRAMQLLVANLKSGKFHQIHLDTAGTNKIAQQFYERLGFQNRGRTRSYLKPSMDKIS
jgi:RimJ/RimL family protein N-acetyltransferase